MLLHFHQESAPVLAPEKPGRLATSLYLVTHYKIIKGRVRYQKQLITIMKPEATDILSKIH